jgi:hypothetical protein
MKKQISAMLGAAWSVFTAMIGYHIHGSLFWAVVDGLFSIIAWSKWLILHEVSISTIRDTFSFFLN